VTPGWVDSATRKALEAEYAQLESDPLDLTVPIVVSALGAVAFVGAYFGFFIGIAVSGSGTLVLASLAVAVVGMAAVVVGTVLLVKVIIGRVMRTRRMNEIDEQLHPPPSSSGPRLEPALVLARF
jgi:uncharacterized integral membrane protein